MDPRPVTPPPRSGPETHTNAPLTPEQVKRIEINRLKAKAKQRQRETQAAASSSNAPNVNNKRPLEVTPATSTSPTAPKPPARLKRDSRLGKYFDYDLSKMVNSKGGFLVEDEKEVDEDRITKERQRERERAVQNLDPPMFLDPSMNPKCHECGSMDIDHTFDKVFRCIVCNKCKNEKPEKYSLLTKTECKEDYLLTDPELRDQELMPHLLKANPHASTFHNMMLYLRCQVEDFAWKKWGSPEALDAEFERRQAEKKKKKSKKFEDGLRELRRRTREGVWQKRKDEEHKHVFGAVERGINGEGKQMSEHEIISTSLEVEQLDTNLFRSKSLWVPTRARGVFGGQVISQATVSATKCVDPQYGLHCYFLLSASPALPILYYVERLRDGRSYTTRSVKAVQKGQVIFIMMCSFHIPEPQHPSHQWKMPVDISGPDELETDEARYRRSAAGERARSPLESKTGTERRLPDGKLEATFWMRARAIPKFGPAFQKCILGYMSDMHFISTAPKELGLDRFARGPKACQIPLKALLTALSSDTFDCSDWLLYVTHSSRTGSGRGLVHGYMYTQDGTLVACTTQEGVVRADISNRQSSGLSKL
ncbi:hypothetical protein BD410DRAFT_712119 [Rickenella mellea]|uniref:DNA repair protein RAD14 n=1 Tax=Rickenella mellea TaxID=50990 RepID=A0A4Y7QN30_9AGAM|nr:hypothetical protein BD410DRAFT_712119 [Rickenella mellea]